MQRVLQCPSQSGPAHLPHPVSPGPQLAPSPEGGEREGPASRGEGGGKRKRDWELGELA